MRKLRILLIGCPVLVAMGLLIQYNRASNLNAENRALQDRVQKLASVALEHDRLVQRVKLAEHTAPVATNAVAEIERLREQVTTQRKEIAKLRGELAAIEPVAGLEKVPFSFRCDSVSKDAWQFAGYDSPEAALQTLLWATAKGDLKVIRASIGPGEEDRRKYAEWRDKTDSEIVEDGMKRFANATGFQILKQEISSSDRMHFTVYLNGIPHAQQPLWMDFEKVGDQWKCSSPPYHPE